MTGALRFSCQSGCSKCCEIQGYVYLTEDDVRRAANYLNLTQAEFERRYIYRTRHLRRLRKPRDGRECGFLENGLCTIHQAKPTHCRLFPFWPEYVESRAAWKKLGNWCPGIGKGELVQIGTAVERANEMRACYPSHY